MAAETKHEQGIQAPAGIIRPYQSTYRWVKDGKLYIQKDIPFGNSWEEDLSNDPVPPETQDLESVLTIGNTTGANNIIVSANQAIKAPTSGTALRGSLNLRDGGDGIVTLTNDNGVQGDSGIYMENLYQAHFIDGWNAAVEIKSGHGTGYIYDVYSSKLLLLISDDFSVPTAPGLHISDTFLSQIDNPANSILNSRPVAFLANRNSSANLGVQGSVALGGQNITMKNDNVAYANTFGFSIPTFGGPFDLLLQPAIISADRTQVFQNADGIIALVETTLPNTGTVTVEALASTRTWEVTINGVTRKILLA